MMEIFTRLADASAHAVGHPLALFVLCLVMAAVYFLVGIEPTNFLISVLSLLLLVLLQATQNRDGAAIQLKLAALIKASEAEDELADIDRKTVDEIEERRP